MRLVLDTNILVSALINPNGPSRKLFELWLSNEFILISSDFQIDELSRVLTYPRLQKYIRAGEAEIIVARIRDLAVIATDLPEINASPDPDDNFILATAVAGNANAVVTGDKKHLLALNAVLEIPIVTVADCVRQLESNDQ